MTEDEVEKEIVLIARRLRKARKQKKLTQLDLSFKSGVSQNMIACIEAGKRNPSFQTMIKLCRALDIRLSDILKDIEPVANTSETAYRKKVKDEIIMHLNAIINLIEEL